MRRIAECGKQTRTTRRRAPIREYFEGNFGIRAGRAYPNTAAFCRLFSNTPGSPRRAEGSRTTSRRPYRPRRNVSRLTSSATRPIRRNSFAVARARQQIIHPSGFFHRTRELSWGAASSAGYFLHRAAMG